jgi:hypothetical protein
LPFDPEPPEPPEPLEPPVEPVGWLGVGCGFGLPVGRGFEVGCVVTWPADVPPADCRDAPGDTVGVGTVTLTACAASEE